MATLPVSKMGKLTGTDLPRFLTKTYELVDDPSLDGVISWNEQGNALVIWRPYDFGRLLPEHFKHNNFSSFIAQLNRYGFKKISRCEYSNDYFRKGSKSLLRLIRRREPIPTPSPVNSNRVATTNPDLIEENKRLEKQNSNLRCEFDRLRSLYNNIAAMMSNLIPTPSPVNPTTSPDLIEENKRLEKQNSDLRCELNRLRSMYNHIAAMMSNLMPNSPEMYDGQSP